MLSPFVPTNKSGSTYGDVFPEYTGTVFTYESSAVNCNLNFFPSAEWIIASSEISSVPAITFEAPIDCEILKFPFASLSISLS